MIKWTKFHIFLEIGKTVGILTDIEIDDTLNIHNQNTSDLNVVQLINILTNFQIPGNIKESFATHFVALEYPWILVTKKTLLIMLCH